MLLLLSRLSAAAERTSWRTPRCGGSAELITGTWRQGWLAVAHFSLSPPHCQATAKNGQEATRNLAPLCEPLTRPSAMTAVLSPLEQSSRDAALETLEDVQMILNR